MPKRKAYSKSSIIRIVGMYKGMDETKIHNIQSAYVRRDANAIRSILGKPSLTDKSAFAQARLADQYVNYIINTPSPNTIRLVKSNYRVNLTSDFRTNLVGMGNIGRGGIPIPPPVFSFPEILRLHPSYRLRKKRFYYETIAKFRDKMLKSDTQMFLNLIDLNGKQIAFIKKHGIKEYRVFIKYKTTTGTEGWVSTQNLTIPSYMDIDERFSELESYIENTIQYELDDYFVVISDIIECRIRWF